MPRAKAVANELLELAERAGAEVDPLQMQKLVYLAQGWTLGLTGERLFDEVIEAWDYGPVVPVLYHSLKGFGASPIRGRLQTYDFAQQRAVPARADFTADEQEIILYVWQEYGSWPGPRLIRLTHQDGSPWQRTRAEHPGDNAARISVDYIREWFEREADEASRVNYDAET